MRCLKDKKQLKFQGGDIGSVIRKTPGIYISKCQGSNCKPVKEIDEFCKSLFFFGFMKVKKYDSSEYAANPVNYTLRVIEMPLYAG